MTVEQMYPRLVHLPHGVRHYKTTATAESWHAWDALPDDRWTEVSWWVDRDMKRCDPDAPGASLHVQKDGVVDGCEIVIFPPTSPREAIAA